MIIKQDNVKIEKNIGKILRKHNIFEFKSESDYISIEDFYKIISYGALYKASSRDIHADEITLTLVSYKKPEKLFKHLQEQWGLLFYQAYDGIYHVQNGPLPIQFILNNRLPKDENIFLWSLRNNLTGIDLENVLNQLDYIGKTDTKQAYINTIIHANLRQFREVIKMAKSGQTDLYPAITELFRYFYEEEKWVPDYIQKDIAEAKKEAAELQKTVSEVQKTASEAQKAASEAQKTASEAQKTASEARKAAAELQEKLKLAAKQMLEDGFAVEMVIKYITLPKETIESLNNDIIKSTADLALSGNTAAETIK